MASQAISGVLGLLRRLKGTRGLNLDNSGLQFLQQWAGDHSPSAVLRLSIGFIEEIEDAQIAIATSTLTQEAKEGLNSTLAGLRGAFGLAGLNTALRSHIPALDSAITNFAIIASMVDAELTPEAKSEIENLSQEVEDLLASVRGSELDPNLREAVARHLGVLLALLRNADAVGIEPAMAAYFELLWQLRKVQKDEDEPHTGGSKAAGFWSQIGGWGERLTKIAEMVDAGSKLIPYLDKVPDLLKYLPH